MTDRGSDWLTSSPSSHQKGRSSYLRPTSFNKRARSFSTRGSLNRLPVETSDLFPSASHQRNFIYCQKHDRFNWLLLLFAPTDFIEKRHFQRASKTANRKTHSEFAFSPFWSFDIVQLKKPTTNWTNWQRKWPNRYTSFSRSPFPCCAPIWVSRHTANISCHLLLVLVM